MTLLSRDAILATEDNQYKEVEISEWGGSVRVKALTAGQRGIVEAQQYEIQQTGKGFEKVSDLAVNAVIWCTVNEDGTQMFKYEDRKALKEKAAGPVMKIRDAVFEVSGLKGEKKAEEDAEDFGGTPHSGSTSD